MGVGRACSRASWSGGSRVGGVCCIVSCVCSAGLNVSSTFFARGRIVCFSFADVTFLKLGVGAFGARVAVGLAELTVVGAAVAVNAHFVVSHHDFVRDHFRHLGELAGQTGEREGARAGGVERSISCHSD